MTHEERTKVVHWRSRLGRPLHSPPHFGSGQRHYLITAACFEHEAHIGYSTDRMNAFTVALLSTLQENSISVAAWVVLPNHYHALVCATSPMPLLKALGKLHGSTSFYWNGEEQCRGRKVWCNTAETVIKSPDHYHATLKYIHHNPVKHRYLGEWSDWPWSSAQEIIQALGKDECERQWQLYPIDSYGADWDDAEY